ncbi:MAG TPA: 1,2-phenylacetyl-CoA epoxidase subunit PaaE [Sediminibacterium sp.]|nr:1,2-phenylacetyl-CoA epoxidase subunit PaaE [Sediminibacterium sp.]
MHKNFETLTIRDVRKETSDCVSVAFDIPENRKELFRFTQGQYITLRTSINGEDIRRSYSICSSPLDGELRVAVKRVPDGLFSTYANTLLKKGDQLQVMAPVGRFYTELDPAAEKQYIAFAAGSGITPIFSIIKTTLLSEPRSRFTLVYGNRNRHSIIFKEQLEALKNKFMGRFSIVHILSREKTDAPIHFGRIDAAKTTALCEMLMDPVNAAAIFLCGPEEMVFCIKETLEQKGVDPKRIHFELFTTGKKTGTAKPQRSTIAPEVKSRITVKQDGTAFEFDLKFEGDSILEAALKQGADLPFACKGGVCCTCKAKLLEGEVEMDVNYGLEADEMEQGFILTCQSHPVTEKVMIDFDVK